MPANSSGPSTRSSVATRGAVAARLSEVVSTKSKNKGKAKSTETRTSTVDPALTEEERLVLLSEKQAQLAAVMDRHDALVREKFHMETFLMMVDYEPQIAKQDDSQVFQNYKSQYDILDAAASVSASPRKTRSSHAGILKLAAPAVAGPSSSLSAPLPRLSLVKSPTKMILKQKAPVEELPRAKGKVKAVDLEDMESISVGLTRTGLSQPDPTSLSPRQLRRRPNAMPETTETSNITAESNSIVQPPRKRRKIGGNTNATAAELAYESNSTLAGATSISTPVNGRIVKLKGAIEPMEPARPPDPGVDATTSSSTGRVMPHRAAAHRPQALPLPLARRQIVTSPSGIKRIKLLVHRPPLRFLSHPRQRPPAPQFNSSVGTFLDSWVDIDGRTYDRGTGSNEEVSRLARTEAALWERVDAMKRAGQWFGSDLFDAFRAGGAEPVSGAVTPFDVSTSTDGGPSASLIGGLNFRPDDAWAAVVNSVVAHGRKRHPSNNSGNPKNRKSRGALIASQVAAKLQAYWDGEATKLDRERVIEERRMKGVARSAMKLVVTEWKKAVFHIREQERLKLEAEELKRGHEHLDAILDQSGHILETQHGDLSRGVGNTLRSRSRSSSVSGMASNEDEDEGYDDEDEAEEEEEDEGEDEEDEGEDEEDEGRMESRADEAEQEETEDEDIGENGGDANTEAEHEEGENDSSLALLLGPRLQSPGSSASPSLPTRDLQTSQLTSGENADRQDNDEDDELSAVVELVMDAEPSSPIQPPSAIEHVVEDPGPPSLQSSVPPDDWVISDGNIDSHSVNQLHRAPLSPKALGSQLPNGSADGSVQNQEEDSEAEDEEEERSLESEIPAYLRPYAVAPVEWDPTKRVTPPLLLRGLLRPYQQSGLEWLASLHLNNLNGILADEMGLGKTIQTIALLAHLACDRGIWGPHLIIVPTSVLLNWEMEFKKFLPGFRILSYHGSTKRRKELRQGWNEKHRFNVCVTSYTLASRDAVVFKRKPWYYMILDEAHMIKNFKSQRWTTLLMFRSFRRLLLTGTPLQNNLTELWSLLQFLMSGSDFVNLKEFGDWFSNPLEKAIEAGNTQDEDTMQRVTKLHTVLRPYLLRRLKRDVEKELPSKYEHLVLCPLSKRQRFLYDEFMSRAQTRDALQSGVYQKIANILMQLRKVCNHPDLFEVRPIVTSFAMERSAIADYEIKELLLRRRLLTDNEETVNLDLLGFRFIDRQENSLLAARETRRLDATARLPFLSEMPGVPPPKDTRTIAGFRAYSEYQRRTATISRWIHIGYLNRLRCNSFPAYSYETLTVARRFYQPLLPLTEVDTRVHYLDTAYLVNSTVKSYRTRAHEMAGVVDRFAFVTPPVVARDLPRIALASQRFPDSPDFDNVLHRASVKLQIAFPDPSLLQYDCGKLQQLTHLLREKKAGGHRVLIFTQMTRILDILEIYLNFHGHLYLRLDGATKIEDRQYITERFNADPRIFCFIASSRSGGVGINLTGADTVIFYDSDFNPQMDRQCEDRAHRIGQIRDVHIYRFVSQHTVEEAMLRKANQKRSLDDLVIQKGEFDWRSLFTDDAALTKALEEFDDTEDAHAAAVATREEVTLEGQDKAEFLDVEGESGATANAPADTVLSNDAHEPEQEQEDVDEEEGGSIADYMIAFVQRDAEYFREWKA